MPEHLPSPPSETRTPRLRFDHSTIHLIPVDDIKVSPEAEAMARDYLDRLKKDVTNEASMAELA